MFAEKTFDFSFVMGYALLKCILIYGVCLWIYILWLFAAEKLGKRVNRGCLIVTLLVFLALAALAVLIFLLIFFLEPTITIDVYTLNGKVRGRIVDSPQGVKVREYLGIPYALPPVGDLRYRDPVPIQRFSTDPYEADDYQNSCLQYLDTTFGDFPGSDMWNAKNPLSEDCLYLNVWTPHTGGARKPVLVWIYGGGFYGGSNQLWVYDGKALAAHGDVIVASFNYRVGSFGFLSTGDGRIKGNFGLKDQQLALTWIKRNIISFGGDPNMITIFGESAGAASVGYHLLNPASDPLFKRAIFQSGSPDAHWAFMTESQARDRSAILTEAVGCPNDDRALQCMRSRPAEDIFNNEWVTSQFLEFPWGPVLDNDFLPDTPYNLLRQGKFQRKDVILGANKDEGTFWILYSVPGFSKDGPSPFNYSMYLDGVDIIDWDLSDINRTQIKQLYQPSDIQDVFANRDALDDVSGDRSFTCPTIKLADILSVESNTYFYYLTHRASNEVWPEWMGVIHGADIQWIFGMPLNSSRGYTEEEKAFSKVIMDYWVNFAKTGNPNGNGNPSWPRYSPSTRQNLHMAAPGNLYTGPNLRDSYCDWWDKIQDQINAQ